MSQSNNNLQNRKLLLEINKMLSSKGKSSVYKNSLLGFCAKLISLKPQEPPYFRKILLRKLILQAQNLKKNRPPSRVFKVLNSPCWQAPDFRIASILISLVLIIALASIIKVNYLQLPTPNQTKETPPYSGYTPHPFDQKGDILHSLPNLSKGSSQILKENYGFKLIEYTLPDGSKIKILKGLL